MAETCSAPHCGKPRAAILDVRPLCREHFISTCYEEMDSFSQRLDEQRFGETAAESARQFLTQCTGQAADLAQSAAGLDNLERARLLDILLWASDLGRHLRRSRRQAASVPVSLRCERLGRAWEEDTQTRVLSMHGVMLDCSHPVECGEVIQIVRKDTGEQAWARVAWARPQQDGGFKIGLEIVHCDNFWGLEWSEEESDGWSPQRTRTNRNEPGSSFPS